MQDLKDLDARITNSAESLTFIHSQGEGYLYTKAKVFNAITTNPFYVTTLKGYSWANKRKGLYRLRRTSQYTGKMDYNSYEHNIGFLKYQSLKFKYQKKIE